jgi:hypothetical protein
MEGFIIDTPEGIEAYRKLALRSMLKLEIETGLRHSRGSVMNRIISENLAISKRTKKGVLAQYEKILKDQGILR